MTNKCDGIIIRGVGGLYSVRLGDSGGTVVSCCARGVFRHEGIVPTVGDRVRIAYTEGESLSDGVIDEIIERHNILIRPPMANLDILFVILSAAKPATITLTADKLIAIAEHYEIEPVIIVSKSELDAAQTERLLGIYRGAGLRVFITDSHAEQGIDALRDYLECEAGNKISAFAGASGVGKSTLMNVIFPTLNIKTAQISRKIERGRHTTRAVELYPLCEIGLPGCTGYLADTPGFSMLDFLHFDFFCLEELPATFREFVPYIGECKYKKCTHLREEGCLIVEAVADGKIALSRHESYVAIYEELKNKHPWDKHTR